MKSKRSYTFEHEGVQTAPTKIPKFEVKYAKKQKPTSTSVAVQTGEAPSNVYRMSTYSPLTQQINLPASVGLPPLMSQTASSPGTVAYTPLPYSPYMTPTALSPETEKKLLDQLDTAQKIIDIHKDQGVPIENIPTPTNPVVQNGEGIPVLPQRPLQSPV